MTFHDWRPQTRRNKIALCIAVFALLLMIGWNLAPIEFLRNENDGTRSEMVLFHLWPEVYRSLTNFFAIGYFTKKSNIDGAFISVSVLFLVSLQLVIIPLWQMFAQSKILRWLAVVVCFSFFGFYVYTLLPFITLLPPLEYLSYFFHILIIMLNFLVLGIALVWFQNDERQAHIPHR
jgi:hypothetical protein